MVPNISRARELKPEASGRQVALFGTKATCSHLQVYNKLFLNSRLLKMTQQQQRDFKLRRGDILVPTTASLDRTRYISLEGNEFD